MVWQEDLESMDKVMQHTNVIIMSTPMGNNHYYELFTKEVVMAVKSKHVSFPNQREQCRLNKFTYTEKCTCGTITLMCNYPFEDPKHKKGVCRASTCTDMRKTLADDVEAIASEETFDDGAEKVTELMGADGEAGSLAEGTELAKEADAQAESEAAHEDAESTLGDGKTSASKPAMAPEDIAKSA